MNVRAFIRAVMACFQGDKAVVPEIKQASENDLYRHRRIKELRSERQSLSILRASLRKRKKRHTHLDPRLVEITTEILRLERGG